MLVLERILAIPDQSVDYLQCGIAGKERAALAARGFVRKDGTKAKDYMIRAIQKTEAAKAKAKAEKAIIKGDKKLPVKAAKGIVPDSIPSNVVFAIQEVERQKIKDKFLGTINPSTQKFNETYQVVPTSKASENSKNTYQKAQSIARENGWDWDGIVKKVAKEDKFFDKNDMRRMKELRTRSNMFARNEKKQTQFMAQNDRDVVERSTGKPMAKTESAQKTRVPIGGKSFNVKGDPSPVGTVKVRSQKIDKADIKNNLALGDKVVLASTNKNIPATVETVKKINKSNIVVDRINSITGKAENRSIPIDNISLIQKKNGKSVSVKGNPITGNLSVEQKQFRDKTGKPKTQNTPIAPDTAKKVKRAIAGVKGGKVVKGVSPRDRGGKASKAYELLQSNLKANRNITGNLVSTLDAALFDTQKELFEKNKTRKRESNPDKEIAVRIKTEKERQNSFQRLKDDAIKGRKDPKSPYSEIPPNDFNNYVSKVDGVIEDSRNKQNSYIAAQKKRKQDSSPMGRLEQLVKLGNESKPKQPSAIAKKLNMTAEQEAKILKNIKRP